MLSTCDQLTFVTPTATSVRVSTPLTSVPSACVTSWWNASSIESESIRVLRLSSANIRVTDSPSGVTVCAHHSAVFTTRHRQRYSAVSFSGSFCFMSVRSSVPAASHRLRNLSAYAVSTLTKTRCSAQSGLPRVRLEHRRRTFLTFKKSVAALGSVCPSVVPPCSASVRLCAVCCLRRSAFMGSAESSSGSGPPHVSSDTSSSTNSISCFSSISTYAPK